MVASLCGNFTFSSTFQSCLCIIFFTSRSQLCTVEICKQESMSSLWIWGFLGILMASGEWVVLTQISGLVAINRQTIR